VSLKLAAMLVAPPLGGSSAIKLGPQVSSRRAVTAVDDLAFAPRGTMKITNNSARLRTDRVLATGAGARIAVGNAGQPAGETAKVQSSEVATRLRKLETQFANGDFDAKKVAEVRAAIAEGRFKVNTEAVADKLVASVADLLGKR
jgi:negative regulator of flagellin synthesis FlgM